ncbi:hypothetical protein NN561_009453 [Cricetulus griseus]
MQARIDLTADAGSSTPVTENNPRVARLRVHLTHLEEASAATWQTRFPGASSSATNSNPSQLPQRPTSLAALVLTSSRRTLPWRLAVWRQRPGLTGRRGESCLSGRRRGNASGCFREPWRSRCWEQRNGRWTDLSCSDGLEPISPFLQVSPTPDQGVCKFCFLASRLAQLRG